MRLILALQTLLKTYEGRLDVGGEEYFILFNPRPANTDPISFFAPRFSIRTFKEMTADTPD